MAKSANPGELRTVIEIHDYPPDVRDTNSNVVRNWYNVFGDGVATRCKWVNAHGNEVYDALAMELVEPATLTLRYSGKVTTTCRVIRKTDGAAFDIISVDNVENRNRWIEIKVRRAVSA